MPVFDGACHCGAVQFRIKADMADLYRCDCSLCSMRGALMTSVHEDSFELRSDETQVSEFNWNTGVARHFFCAVCGIYPFHRKRAMPDHYGVNVNCLKGFDAAGHAVRAAEGRSMSVRSSGRSIWTGPQSGG
jgi:hypothetical protein